MMIDTNTAQTAISRMETFPVVQNVDRAFLVLSYDPGADIAVFPEGYPIFEIPLVSAQQVDDAIS